MAEGESLAKAAPPHRTKKKGKSFLQKAKKFGRQGQRGKGTQIEQDQYDYLVRVMERWRDGFGDAEEKRMFVENVMEQTMGVERQLCGNQLASRVIELLLPSANNKVLVRLSSALSEDLRLSCVDPFMSHVLEKLLLLRSFRGDTVVEELETGELLEARDWVVKVCKFVTNNVEDFCQDTYASHILRTCTQCLVRRRCGEERQAAATDKKTEGYDLLTQARLQGEEGQVLEEVLETFTIRIMALSPEVLLTELCVRMLQPKTARGMARHLLTVCYSGAEEEEGEGESGSSSGAVDWDDSSVVRLLESVVVVAASSEKLIKKVLKEVIRDKVMELAQHPVANFVVQRLLEQVGDKDQLTGLLFELSNNGGVEQLLASGSTGVILAMAKAAVRLETGQAALLGNITAALHCSDAQDDLALLLAHLVTREVWAEGEHPPVHLHGSLILQQLLLFSKPIKVVRSLLSVAGPQLAALLSDPRGSHITDTFVTSKSIGEKSREGLVRALRGEIVTLACSKHGSRTIDALWKCSGTKMKQVMVEELSLKIDVINSNKFGKFIAQKCFVAVFKRSKEDWRKVIEKEGKVEEMFSDILGDGVKVERKRKAEKDIEAVAVPEAVTEEKCVSSVDQWLEVDTKKPPVKKKKKKAKSYLDDL